MNFPVEKHFFLRSRLACTSILAVFFCVSSLAQGMNQASVPAQVPVPLPSTRNASKPTARTPNAGTPAAHAQSTGRGSGPAAQTAQPALVTLKQGVLQVQADDSDLHQILREIADRGGMTIDGSVPSVRVYGKYGPGNSRDVLTDLLTGLGYNFMMVGTTQRGVPQKLLLTDRINRPSAPAVAALPAPAPAAAEADAPGPGAIVNVPPAGPDDPQERAQQNLQRLQQMHDQQTKPNEPQ